MVRPTCNSQYRVVLLNVPFGADGSTIECRALCQCLQQPGTGSGFTFRLLLHLSEHSHNSLHLQKSSLQEHRGICSSSQAAVSPGTAGLRIRDTVSVHFFGCNYSDPLGLCFKKPPEWWHIELSLHVLFYFRRPFLNF